MRPARKTWNCSGCGETLGVIEEGELKPVPRAQVKTDGVNLRIYCVTQGCEIGEKGQLWFSNDRTAQVIHRLIEYIVARVVEALRNDPALNIQSALAASLESLISTRSRP